jgi:hypothetical protein
MRARLLSITGDKLTETRLLVKSPDIYDEAIRRSKENRHLILWRFCSVWIGSPDRLFGSSRRNFKKKVESDDVDARRFRFLAQE